MNKHFLEGIKSAFTLIPSLSYSVPNHDGFILDAKNMRHDVAMIGGDMRKAIKKVESDDKQTKKYSCK